MIKTSFKINKGLLNGEITIPPSKSVAHRALICAALSFGKCCVSPINTSSDMKATISCLRALGCKIEQQGETVHIDSSELLAKNNHIKSPTLDCCESGSTVRFMIPIASLFDCNAKFIGEGRLPLRPLDVFEDCLPELGVSLEKEAENYLPLITKGKLVGGDVHIRGDISSQFITGLLLALPLCSEDSKIILTTPLQSAGYIDITLKVMEQFGVCVTKTDYGYFIKGNQHYKAQNYTVEGDWSQAAFFIGSGVLGGNITIKGLDKNSLQGDKACLNIFKQMGGNIYWQENDLIVNSTTDGYIKPINLNCENVPDIVPILSAVAIVAKGESTFYNAERLRIKESDRLQACFDLATNLGGTTTKTNNSLTIKGNDTIIGGKVDGVNDHRIVMSTAIISTISKGEVIVTDGQSINKSYPNFIEDFKNLGGNIDVINMG